MTKFINTNQKDNQIMDDYIFRKYIGNINSFAESVKIFPLGYKNKSTFSKKWHIYFFYYQNGKRKKYHAASFISNGQNIQINRSKTHKVKIQNIKTIFEYTVYQLKNDPRFITSLIYGEKEAFKLYPHIFGDSESVQSQVFSIKNAFEKALEIKKKQIAPVSYKGLKNTSDRFLAFIGKTKDENIDVLNKKMLLDFLNSNLDTITSRTFNNNRTALSSLLSVLQEYDHINENFIRSIKKLKSTPKINKAFSNSQRIEISEYLKKTNTPLYIYYLHIYYGLMRPKTIIRLKVKDINIEKMIFDTQTKTGNFVKFIPKILMDEFYSKLDLSGADKNDYIFTKKGFLGNWLASEINRRDSFTKKFKLIKSKFKLDDEYTFYSFRHSAIGNMFDAKCQELKNQNESNYIDKALDFIRQFTNHTTNEQTKQYLRGISTEINVDWSDYLN